MPSRPAASMPPMPSPTGTWALRPRTGRRCLPRAVSARSTSWSTAAVPRSIQTARRLALPSPATEAEALAELRALAAANRPMVQMIGLGYSDTFTPPVIRRNVLENPAWYTAYTPYQPEISQGRLEALVNFQTMVSDLTGLPVAGASLLDEATAAAEAMLLVRRTNRASKSNRFVVDAGCAAADGCRAPDAGRGVGHRARAHRPRRRSARRRLLRRSPAVPRPPAVR